MLLGLNDIRGCDIRAADGEIGRTDDLYFDDASWRIRYLVVNTAWLFGRKVLIAPEAVPRMEPGKGKISVSLTQRQIEQAPGIGTDLPVSKREERMLRQHYGWPPYWDVYPVGLGPLIPRLDTPAQMAPIGLVSEEDRGDPHLRSAKEVDGYHISARDGEIGHVEDFLFEQETWFVRYLVVDTRNWLPGRKVLVTPYWATGIDWAERYIAMDLTREAVRNSPDYDSSRPISRQYEVDLHGHFGRRGYWE